MRWRAGRECTSSRKGPSPFLRAGVGWAGKELRPATRTGDSDPVSILQATAMARRVRRGWRSGPLRSPQLAHFAGLCGKGMPGGDAAAARGSQVLATHRRRRGESFRDSR